jgi:hypothetical protein
MAYENNQAEFAIYTNAVVIEGEVVGGVHNDAEEALAEARNLVAELEGLDRAANAALDALDAAALEDRLNEQDVVGFAMIAERSVLFS